MKPKKGKLEGNVANGKKLAEWIDGQDYRNAWMSKRLVCNVRTIENYRSGSVTPPRATREAIETITQGAVPADQWGK